MYMLMLFISIIIVIFYVHKLWNYVSQLSHHDTYLGIPYCLKFGFDFS